MLTGTHQRLARVDNFTVKAKDTVLSRVYQFKYLGVVLDPCLSWNDHVDYIGRKVSARLGMLRRARKVISRESCITLYNAMVLPIFDYCATIWDSCGRTNRDYLDKLHRRAASIIEGNKVSQPQVAQVFSWPSLQSHRDYLKCMLVFKCFVTWLHPICLRNFTIHANFTIIIRAIEICCVRLLRKHLSIRAPSGLAELKYGTASR